MLYNLGLSFVLTDRSFWRIDMNRAHFAVAATLVSTTMFAGAVVAAQSTQARNDARAGRQEVHPAAQRRGAP